MSGRIGVVTNPASLVTYGTASQVTAAVTSATGAALPGQRLDLYYRIGTGSWHAVASGLTGSTGRVSLRAVLPASASLLLKHPLGAVTAANVAPRFVHVARRVTTSAHHGITVGQTIVTTGSVAPSRAIGARVSLLRYVSGSWRTVAYGRMTTHTAYRVAYKPTVAGTYVLRTSVPSDATHSAGYGASWKQAVARETVAMVASAILHNTHITLATVHESGVSDGATARDDMLALAAGRLAPRSSYQHAPGGSTSVTIGLLRALRALGTKARVTVSEIAGGSHAVGSSHYYGKAMDITVVNGVSISAGGNYSLVASICRSYGATTVYDPAYDPYGGHGNHVHCQWGSGRD
jgi:hypothetical protein